MKHMPARKHHQRKPRPVLPTHDILHRIRSRIARNHSLRLAPRPPPRFFPTTERKRFLRPAALPRRLAIHPLVPDDFADPRAPGAALAGVADGGAGAPAALPARVSGGYVGEDGAVEEGGGEREDVLLEGVGAEDVGEHGAEVGEGGSGCGGAGEEGAEDTEEGEVGLVLVVRRGLLLLLGLFGGVG